MDEEAFFLCNYGQGYTDDGVRQMPVARRRWTVQRLSKKLKDEAEQRKQLEQQARAASKRRR